MPEFSRYIKPSVPAVLKCFQSIRIGLIENFVLFFINSGGIGFQNLVSHQILYLIAILPLIRSTTIDNRPNIIYELSLNVRNRLLGLRIVRKLEDSTNVGIIFSIQCNLCGFQIKSIVYLLNKGNISVYPAAEFLIFLFLIRDLRL